LASSTDLLLASLKKIAVMQKEGLHLVDASRSHEDEVKNCKETQLKIEGAIPNFPKGEAAEKSRENVEVELVPDVILYRVSAAVL
jgi:hypothetical protein